MQSSKKFCSSIAFHACLHVAGNQLNGLNHSSSSYVHGSTSTWPSVAQWGLGASDAASRQSRSAVLIGGPNDQHKEMADMFNLLDNANPEFNDLSGMFNNYT